MNFHSILSDKFKVDQKDLYKASDEIRNSLTADWTEKITKTIDEWCLRNYERVTGFVSRHLDYWDVDQFEIISRQDPNQNIFVDYTLTHKGQFVSRLVINSMMRYKIENDDGDREEIRL